MNELDLNELDLNELDLNELDLNELNLNELDLNELNLNDLNWDDSQIADEMYRFILNTFAWKNRHFDLSHDSMNRKHSSFRKSFIILFLISQIENCTLSALEKRLCENRSTISIAVSKLCDEGLVIKHYPGRGDDGRKVYYKITKKGSEELCEHQQVIKDDIKSFVVLLPPESKKFFMNGVDNLNKALESINNQNEHRGIY